MFLAIQFSLEEIQISLAAVFIHDSQFISTFSWVIEIESLARAKRARVVQDEVEKANWRPTDPTGRPTDTAPLTPWKLTIFDENWWFCGTLLIWKWAIFEEKLWNWGALLFYKLIIFIFRPWSRLEPKLTSQKWPSHFSPKLHARHLNAPLDENVYSMEWTFYSFQLGRSSSYFIFCISIPKIVRLLRLRHLFIEEMTPFFKKR